jgi:hypothetical protein
VSEEKATGYVDNLFDRAKAVRFEMLLDRLGVSVQKHGEELRGICPIPAHSGEKKKPSFYVNPDKQVFNCFACKAKGNIVTFAQAYTGLATSAIPGQHLSALISMGYIFGFRKDIAILFNGLGQNHPERASPKRLCH